MSLRRPAIASAVAALAMSVAPPASAAPGALDPAFGTRGQTIVPFEVSALATLPDARIVVGGTTADAAGRPAFALARYTADGQLDPTFGSGGIVVTQLASGSAIQSQLYALAVEPDGGAVAVGQAGVVGDSSSDTRAVAAQRVDGAGRSVWTAVHQLGVAAPQGASKGARSGAVAVAIQADGNIVAVGDASDDRGLTNDAILRLDGATGALDPTFSDDGYQVELTPPRSYSFQSASSLTITPSGSILMGSSRGSCNFVGCTLSPAVLAYTPSGARDPAFAVDRSAPESVDRLSARPNGSILGLDLFGRRLLRYRADGQLDRTFASPDGIENVPGLFGGAASDVAVAAGERIVLAVPNPDAGRPGSVARLLPDGSLDGSFGDRGMAPLASPVGLVAMQSSGAIIAAGGAVLTRLSGGLAFGIVALRSSTLQVQRRAVSVALRCGRHGALPCSGTVRIVSAAKAPVTFGQADYRLAADASATVAVSLNRAARRRIGRARHLRLAVRAVVSTAGAPPIQRRLTLTATRAALR